MEIILGFVAFVAVSYGIAGWKKAAQEGQGAWGRLSCMSWRIGGVFSALLLVLVLTGIADSPF